MVLKQPSVGLADEEAESRKSNWYGMEGEASHGKEKRILVRRGKYVAWDIRRSAIFLKP